MTTELVTEAFRTNYPYSFWWVLVPVIGGIVLFFWGTGLKNEKTSDRVMSLGAIIFLIGTFIVAISNIGFRDTTDEEMLKSDISEQLQIENVDITTTNLSYAADNWHVGKGPNGEFVEFALLRDGDSGNKYIVVYK